ncbi:MAG: hypothetical protein IPK15_19055 [Verrucomicrobia bacterium]|nr:hypothetical protein [Verrucomicrobiota bacterium]
MNKRFADEPAASRALVVNSNGTVLPPLDFTSAEIDATGVFDIGFQPGVTNCHVTIEVSSLDGTISVEIPGPVTAAKGRKGWDGCI